MDKKVLLVGPIHHLGVGGRFEEMKVWENILTRGGHHVSVFSMFNSNFLIGNAKMFESASILLPFIWKIRIFNFIILRFWKSKYFKKKRDEFYFSKKWVEFIYKFDLVILFITHLSREISIFESSISIPVYLRFTGIVSDFSYISHHNNISHLLRYYVFHSKVLKKGLESKIKSHYVDQTSIYENELINIPVSGNFKTFAMIGLFMEVKQMDTVIKMFKRFPDCKLLLFGSGELLDYFSSIIKNLDLVNVEILGFFPSNEIKEMYSRFDCLIINSSEETGPMTGIEALASGKVIFSKPVGSMPDRIDSEFLYNSIEDLENLILHFSSLSSSKIFDLRFRSREIYLERFSIGEIQKAIYNILN